MGNPNHGIIIDLGLEEQKMLEQLKIFFNCTKAEITRQIIHLPNEVFENLEHRETQLKQKKPLNIHINSQESRRLANLKRIFACSKADLFRHGIKLVFAMSESWNTNTNPSSPTQLPKNM